MVGLHGWVVSAWISLPNVTYGSHALLGYLTRGGLSSVRQILAQSAGFFINPVKGRALFGTTVTKTAAILLAMLAYGLILAVAVNPAAAQDRTPREPPRAPPSPVYAPPAYPPRNVPSVPTGPPPANWYYNPYTDGSAGCANCGGHD